MGTEGKPSEFGNFLRSPFREFGMRVQPRADRGSANGEIVESIEHLLQALDIALQQAGPSTELLSEGEWDGVLQVGAADFYYVFKFFRLGGDGVMNSFHCGNQRVGHAFRGRDVHCCRKRVIGRL